MQSANCMRYKNNYFFQQRRDKNMKSNSNIKQKREEIKIISTTLKELKENGSIQTINEGLKEIYKQQGNADLRTYEQWKKAGFQIKRGAKALYLWGRQTAKTITENGEEKEITYFPLVAVFSENQVYNSFNNK